MGVLLDLVGSFIVGGLLLLTILNVNVGVNQQSIQNEMSINVQENMVELVSEIEYDFRKIGYGLSNPALAIVRADTSSLKFLSDLNNDGILDSVMYSLSATNQMLETCNPRDRRLTRKVNTQSVNSSLGVVSFKMRFFDVQGVVTTSPSLIKSIEYSLVVENAFPVDTTYARSTWKGVIRPRNL
jgi:hypothetical protein